MGEIQALLLSAVGALTTAVIYLFADMRARAAKCEKDLEELWKFVRDRLERFKRR